MQLEITSAESQNNVYYPFLDYIRKIVEEELVALDIHKAFDRVCHDTI